MERNTHFGNDYQFGHCHYFAEYLLTVFKKILPKQDIKYHLLFAERYDNNGDVIDEVLIHAYLRIGEYLIDSEGVQDLSVASEREKEFTQREKDLTPDGYDFAVWEEELDFIPEIFFNKFCSKKKLKSDVTDFVTRFDVKELIKKLK
jgi:hypothetical protein